MAHIRTRTSSVGKKTYQVRWVDAADREQTQTFERMEDARRYRTRIESELQAGTYLDPKLGQITFRDYAEEWRALQIHHRDGTAEHYRHHLAAVYPLIGNLRLGAARRGDIVRMVRALTQQGHSPAYTRARVAAVVTVFASAVDDELIPRSPCTKLPLPELEERTILIPTDEQMRDILAGFPTSPWYRDLWAVAAGTGMRSGELRGLTVDRVNFLRREIKVDRQLVRVERGAPVFGPPKTKASVRTIPVAQSVIDLLARRAEGLAPGGLLFTGRLGQPLSRTALGEALRSVLGPLDWPTRTGLHLCRHYYASMLIHAGLTVKEVQARLGHATAQETLDTYGWLWPDSDDRSREAVESILGGLLSGSSA